MQKKISCVCIVLLLLTGSLPASEVEVVTGFESYRNALQMENAASYRYNFLPQWQLFYTGEYITEQDNAFDRENRVANFSWGIGRQQGLLRPAILFDSQLSTEEGKLESGSYDLKQRQHGAGFVLDLTPSDSFYLSSRLRYLQQQEDYDQFDEELEETHRGYESDSRLSVNQDFNWYRLQLDTRYRLNEIENDNDRNYSVQTAWDMTLPNHRVSAKIGWEGLTDEINKPTSQTDQQNRDQLSGAVDYTFSLIALEQVHFFTDYQQIKNRFDIITTKNYDETGKTLGLDFSFPVDRFRFSLNAKRQLDEKEYQSGINALETDYREFVATIHYAISERDSITFYRSIDLRQTDMPEATIRTDNDRLQERMNVGIYYYLYDRIHVSTLFYVLRTEQVYLFSEMSGNNRVNTSYNLQPEITVAYGSRFQIRQEYAIRADYEDYEWSDIHTDRFYRRLEAGASLIYDESQDMRISSGGLWDHLRTNRDTEHPLTAILSYQYENSASGEKEDDYYEITLERETHEVSLEMIQSWERFNIRSLSIMTWSTYKELQQRLELNVFLSEFSMASIAVHPVSRDFEEPEWKLNIDIALSFK